MCPALAPDSPCILQLPQTDPQPTLPTHGHPGQDSQLKQNYPQMHTRCHGSDKTRSPSCSLPRIEKIRDSREETGGQGSTQTQDRAVEEEEREEEAGRQEAWPSAVTAEPSPGPRVTASPPSSRPTLTTVLSLPPHCVTQPWRKARHGGRS